MPRKRNNLTSTCAKGSETRSWYLFDAQNQILGRLATKAADIISGRKKVTFSTHNDQGDFLIIINAKEIQLSSNKAAYKQYTRYSGYPGGLSTFKFKEIIDKKSDYIVRHAIKGMLPKNKLAPEMITRLYIYPGSEHPHQAQQPIKINL